MMLPESRPLKIAGLVLLAVASALFGWVSSRAALALQFLHEGALFLALTLVGVNIAAAGALLLSAGCGLRTSWRNPRRRRALLLQVLLANVLVPAVAYGMLTEVPEIEAGFEASGLSIVLSVLGMLVIVIAVRLWIRAQKYEAPGADEAMAADARPPVLYLRSFQDDGDASIDARQWKIRRSLITRLGVRTPEQELASILDHLGPVIAIGKPGEPLPELGAARLYVSHAEWQQTVTALMQRASLIVIRVAGSAGVLWEIEHALTLVPRHRVAFILLGNATPPPDVVAKLSPVMGGELASFLPEPESRLQWLLRDPRRRIGSMVCFPSGVPRTVPLAFWPFRARDLFAIFPFRFVALPLRTGWRRIYALLEFDAMHRLDRPSRLVAVILALLFGMAGAHWFYLGQRRRGVKYILLFVVVPMFLSYYDAVRFILADRATFEAEYASRASTAAQR